MKYLIASLPARRLGAGTVLCRHLRREEKRKEEEKEEEN